MTVWASDKLRVAGCVMNALGGNNTSGVIWSTHCKEHSVCERSISASPGPKDVDEVCANVVCPQGLCLKAAEFGAEFVKTVN